MSPENSSPGHLPARELERRAGIAEARALLAAALELLDLHARSPAAATVDLAIHHIDVELAE